ncbi:MAG: pyridoxamine 5'-phosphate oxidase family protein [Bacillota bacterium]
MDREKGMKNSLKLANRSKIAMLATNGEDGYPNIKALFKAKNEGLKKIWFSTNASSKRVKQLKTDNKVSVYFVNKLLFEGLMLVGDIEIHNDLETKKRFWQKGDKKYYPLGVEDPDYVILCFTAKWGNYYSLLKNTSFDI